MNNNLISVQIADADLEKLQDAIKTIQGILNSHLISLSPTERQEMPKMSDKTITFVQKTLDYAKANLEFVPSYLNLPELEIDLKAVNILKQLINPLLKITTALDDTAMVSGSEAYQAALIYYASVKDANKRNVLGAKTIYEDLSTRFPGRPSKKNPPV
jgi:hypothetical protein